MNQWIWPFKKFPFSNSQATFRTRLAIGGVIAGAVVLGCQNLMRPTPSGSAPAMAMEDKSHIVSSVKVYLQGADQKETYFGDFDRTTCVDGLPTVWATSFKSVFGDHHFDMDFTALADRKANIISVKTGQERFQFKLDEYPSYKVEVAANPFEVYKTIPATARYQFLLDSSLYFVSTFIKGSVCEGEAAVSVIDEKFFIFFADPNNRSQGALDAFTAHVARDLAIPNVDGFMDAFYGKYKASQMDFVNERKKMIDAVYPLGLSLYDIWDGAGKNNQAVLTVFRHDDNSYVRHGAIGEVPKTAWVMDYPIFERMYYLLAAGFDVFGSVSHQASTRLYMDNLRVESEDLFLSFLPAEDRDPIRKGWYRGEFAKKKMEWLNPYG
ncbi:MAG: hypothetical protein EOP10_28160, partial [Proteobacteria bacterium]